VPFQSNGSPDHVIYDGKADERVILAASPARLLQLWPDVHCYGVAAGNRLIYGDNLPIQIALLDDPQVRGKVQVAYIDPPFATGGVFQSRSQSDAYTDLLSGAGYIEFLRARLILLRELLAPTGSIYVHLDSNMAFSIKLIMDEVYGRRNFRNWITRKKCNPKNYTRKAYGNVCDFILFYTKTDEYVWHRPVESWTDERAAREYQYIDEKTGRRYKKVPVHAPGVRHGATGGPWKGKPPPPGKHWQYTPDKLDEMDARGEIYWSPTGNPRRKIFLDDSAGVAVQDLWLEYRDAHNQNIRITGYPTEKNPGLLQRIISASSNPGDLVLDSFSGSGTTLAIASELGRRWIGIDNSAEAIAVTLRRFAKELEPMGDFVNGNGASDETDESASDTLPLFASLDNQLPAVATKAGEPAHKPIRDFTLYAEQRVASNISHALDQWRTDIGESVPLAMAKESQTGRWPAPSGHGHSSAGTSIAASASDPWASAIAHLIKADPILAKIIRDVGPCRLKRQKGGFAHLAQAIVNQQLSKAAADAIMKRLVALPGNKRVTAESLQTLSDAAIKSAGVSVRKIAYLRDLAGNVLTGQLDFRRLPHLSDEEVIRELTEVKGIGRWTAEMYLIFVLGRPDVLPLDDTALRAAIGSIYQLKESTDRSGVTAIADSWRPYRTIACWYLWSRRNASAAGVTR
jgi:adenine-specific DNA-methyltransferase